MKKVTAMLMLVMALSLLSACGRNVATPNTDATTDPANLVTIMVNIEGLGGNIEMTEDGTEPKPDPEYPMQSGYANVERGTVVKILAEPEEGYHFFKWTANGTEYSTEPLITVTAEEDTEFRAEFLPEGKDGKHVDLDTVTTLGDLLGLLETETSLDGTTYIYAFEQDGNTYRAICDVPEEISEALFDLDYDDPDYSKKEYELIAPLPVKAIENLTEGMPTQEEAEQYIGKTGQELLDDDWYIWHQDFTNPEKLKFGMTHGFYYYTVTFEGEIKDIDNFDEDTDMAFLTVTAITCDGVGDATYWPEE